LKISGQGCIELIFRMLV